MIESQEELMGMQLEKVTGGEQFPSMVIVPNVIGKMFIEAKNELVNVGFIVDSKYENSSKVKDIVLSSDPLQDTKAEKDSKIVLTLSNGRGK